jgi:hypothetical protein
MVETFRMRDTETVKQKYLTIHANRTDVLLTLMAQRFVELLQVTLRSNQTRSTKLYP